MFSIKERFIKASFAFYRRYLAVYNLPSCRFMPTCSYYTEDALLSWGIWRGLVLGAARILRCQPLCRTSYDPPPQNPRKA